jgi:hypothetical protein
MSMLMVSLRNSRVDPEVKYKENELGGEYSNDYFRVGGLFINAMSILMEMCLIALDFSKPRK